MILPFNSLDLENFKGDSFTNVHCLNLNSPNDATINTHLVQNDITKYPLFKKENCFFDNYD